MRRTLSDYALLTVPDAARFLKVSAPTVRRMIEDGRLPSISTLSHQKIDPLDLFLYVVAEREGMSVEAYVEKHGPERAADAARERYRMVRRFAA